MRDGTGNAGNNIRFSTRQVMLLLVFAALTAVTLAAAHFSLSDNADLKHLSISDGGLTPNFNPNVVAYTATVDNATDSVDVTAVPAHGEAILTIFGILTDSGTPRTVGLDEGANNVVLAITAEDGVTHKSYTVVITREAAP